MEKKPITFHVDPIDEQMMRNVLQRQHDLAKPFGSLGRLEQLSAQIAGITGQMYPRLGGKAMVVFASDNGVWDEGVTPIGKDVTMLQATNMVYGRAGIGVLSAHANAKLFVVDVGMEIDSPAQYILRRKIRRSTSNIVNGPAMSCDECVRAMEIGAEMAQMCQEQGMILVGAGEMGVGNTTTSSAVLSALTGLDPTMITGKGAGITQEAYLNKINVIKKALQVNQYDKTDPIDVVAKVGGFDIAAMAGFYLKSAELHMIPVVDGFIAITSALVASRVQPNIKEYFVLSHRSAEMGYDVAAQQIGQKPLLDMEMRLGEGTGCPLAFNIVEAAVRVLRDMATFDECRIDSSVVFDEWEDAQKH